ncbi:MAG: radical SAM protein [Candidatus Woesearchaeota archaeon]
MKKVLCIYPPFCSPVSPSYSVTYLAQFLQANALDFCISILDLNAITHYEQFKAEYAKVKSALEMLDLKEYAKEAHELKIKIEEFSKSENRKIRIAQKSPVLQFCLDKIASSAPDIVLMSVVYNSQDFFSLQLARELKKLGIQVIVGGPAVTAQLKEAATYLPNEFALLEHLIGHKAGHSALVARRILDYSVYDFSIYLTSQKVICLKTTSCCYYQRCTFCTHHNFGKYVEYDLEDIKKSIILSESKLVFFTDDMIHKKRLLELAKITKELQIDWMCQLRPMKELDEETFKILHDSGLKVVLLGVESGNNRILSLMDKGTNTAHVELVLQASKKAGITTVTYIIFGFPTETKEEFIDTIRLLKRNIDSIDLISTSVFGLQEGSIVSRDPKKFSIAHVERENRAMLPDKITYGINIGLHKDDARQMKQRYAKTLNSINKFPREMNVYREHMLYFVSKNK